MLKEAFAKNIVMIVSYLKGLSSEEKIISILYMCHQFYTTFSNLSMKYLEMCKVYTDVGGLN